MKKSTGIFTSEKKKKRSHKLVVPIFAFLVPHKSGATTHVAQLINRLDFDGKLKAGASKLVLKC